MPAYRCEFSINEKTGQKTFIMQNSATKNSEGVIRLNQTELAILFNNFKPICEEIKKLEKLNNAVVESDVLAFTVNLSRTKTVKVIKKMRKNKIVCGFCRPLITKDGRKYAFHILLSATKWKWLLAYLHVRNEKLDMTMDMTNK